MAGGKPLTCRAYIRIDGKDILWFELDEKNDIAWRLPEEAVAEKVKEMLMKGGRALSEYMSNHPESTLWQYAE